MYRVKNDSCEVHPHFQRVIGNCYAEYSIDVEDRDSFGSGVRVRADPSAWMYKVVVYKEPSKNDNTIIFRLLKNWNLLKFSNVLTILLVATVEVEQLRTFSH